MVSAVFAVSSASVARWRRLLISRSARASLPCRGAVGGMERSAIFSMLRCFSATIRKPLADVGTDPLPPPGGGLFVGLTALGESFSERGRAIGMVFRVA